MTIHEIKSRGLLLFECISGSKAYGLDTVQSDTDIKGVYYLPKAQFYGLNYIPQIADKTNDEAYYELGRFVDLLLKNNPNILELLATPEQHVLYRHPLMKSIQPELFLSKLCKETFAGYAITQIRKARGYKKKIVNPVAQERKSVPDFCYIIAGAGTTPLISWLQQQGVPQEDCGLTAIPHAKGLYALYSDSSGNKGYKGIVSGPQAHEVLVSAVAKGSTPSAYMFFNQEGYSMYCKEYREYWDWVAKRNEVRYAGNMAHGKDYDAKNMMHTIRLLQVAKEIAHTGKLIVQRSNREELLAIKRGDYEYDALLDMADTLMMQIDAAFITTTLPNAPDKALVEHILTEIRTILYQ